MRQANKQEDATHIQDFLKKPTKGAFKRANIVFSRQSGCYKYVQITKWGDA